MQEWLVSSAIFGRRSTATSLQVVDIIFSARQFLIGILLVTKRINEYENTYIFPCHTLFFFCINIFMTFNSSELIQINKKKIIYI